MRVLVTGGAGFIGSSLVRALLGSGHEVGVIDDLSTGSEANLHPASWHRTLDINAPGLPAAVAEFGPEGVVHLAAQVSVSESVKDPARDLLVNVEGTRAVARAAREAGARRFLFASSAAVYGEPERVPVPEIARKAPENPYGEDKLLAEGVIAEELGGVADFASFRLSNVYGPRQSTVGEGGVVALFAESLAEGHAPVVLGSGEQTRDFIYVGDVAWAFVTGLGTDTDLALEGADGASYNVATGSQTSINELVSLMRGVSRYLGPVERGPARPGDVQRSALDPEKAGTVFGWEARTELEKGLAFTLKWFEGARRDGAHED